MEIKITNPTAYLQKVYNSSIDNAVFKLHYRFTVFLLLCSCVIISTKQFFGEPIHCMSGSEKVKEIIDTYCWIHGTFILKKPPKENIIGKHVISNGVGTEKDGDEVIHQKYYQWVCVMLLIQSLMFYLPYFLWKNWENNTIKQLSSELDSCIDKSKWTTERKSSLVNFFTEGNSFNFYAIRFAVCEVLNLGNVIGQILLLNWMFEGSFHNYGPAVASFLYSASMPNSVDPMAWVFPKMTKCKFETYGSSGTIQNLDLLCVLPLNVVNEKLFALLWFWFIFLVGISSIAILYRCVVFCCPLMRGFIMIGKVRSIPRSRVIAICKRLSVGEWFILQLLSKNLNPIIFKELLLELDNQCQKKNMAFL